MAGAGTARGGRTRRGEPFADRAQAGSALARVLTGDPRLTGAVVLALPRGGVPVAGPVAAALGAPLDVLVVRKLGLPGHPELAMGALAGIAGDVVEVRNEAVLRAAGVSPDAFAEVRATEAAELRRREAAYRGDRAPQAVAGRTVLVVDDGAATGATVRAAVAALRRQGAARVVVALPVCPPDTARLLAVEADGLVCLREPAVFAAVGQEYGDFAATPDAEVCRVLDAARARGAEPPGPPGPPS